MHEFDHPYQIRHIALVGVGGTGSILARHVARILYDMEQRNQQTPTITLIDPDRVERHNVGRQMFIPADIGQHKAKLMAIRLSSALGLKIGYITEPFDAETHLEHEGHHTKYGCNLILGCVDNYQARRTLASADSALWIDCGNYYDGGQVVIGNSDNYGYMYNRERNPALNFIPNVAHVYPDILEPEEDESDIIQVVGQADNADSCAELVLRGDQHLLINEYVALAAAQMTYKVLHRQPIQHHEIFVSSEYLTMKPKPINPPAQEKVS